MDKDKPVVSVITPCYNGEEHGMLHEYFNGLLDQTYEEVELIFVNDGSTDGTEEIYFDYEPKLEDKFNRCKYIPFEENQGNIIAMNTAIEHVTGKYVSIIDSDDIMLPHKIESHVDFLEEHDEYGMVYSDGYVVKKNDLKNPVQRFFEDKETPSGNLYEEVLLQKCWFPCGTYCFRSKCLQDIPKLKDEFDSQGKNVQILCSVAYYYKIGYNDVDPVMKIVVRSDSLSRRMDLENLHFKTFVRKDLDHYIIAKFGASEETRKKIKAKYKKREVLYYFLSGQESKLKVSYNDLKSLYKQGIREKVPWMVIYSSTLLYSLSFFPSFWKVIPKAIMKTNFISELF